MFLFSSDMSKENFVIENMGLIRATANNADEATQLLIELAEENGANCISNLKYFIGEGSLYDIIGGEGGGGYISILAYGDALLVDFDDD